MPRLIDADEFMEYHCDGCPYREEGSCTENDPICATIQDLKDFPTVDAVEVVHGRWIDRYGGKYAIPAYDCSECKKSAPLMHDMDMLGNWKARQFFANYCPNCGAKMDGDGNG